MRPGYELLWLAAHRADDRELRALARAHPRAREAAHASRSYRAPLALIAWHNGPVGVDLERVLRTNRSFAESICTPGEIAHFGPQLEDDAFVTSLWASKEALAKALGDPLDYDPRRLESPLGWWQGCAGVWRAKEFIPASGHVAWLVWSDADQKSAARPPSAASTRPRAGRR